MLPMVWNVPTIKALKIQFVWGSFIWAVTNRMKKKKTGNFSCSPFFFAKTQFGSNFRFAGADGLFTLEALAVCALVHSGIGFMGANADFFQSAIIVRIAVVCALGYRTFNIMIRLVTVHGVLRLLACVPFKLSASLKGGHGFSVSLLSCPQTGGIPTYFYGNFYHISK